MMAGRTTFRPAWALGAIAVWCLAASGERIVVCEERGAEPMRPSGAKILFPPDRAILMVGTFHVIVKGGQGDLYVDGQAQPWEPFEPPLRVAKVGLCPGTHEIRVGNQSIRFVVALSEEEHDGPKDWPLHYLHSINAQRRCSGCHATHETNGRLAVGALKPSDACFACHRRDRFQDTHVHLTGPLDHCRDCHALHDAMRRPLMKTP
jgi:predicted CXXCH cytochrome family protein